MLKKILSMKVAVGLLFVFGVVIGVATFIENDYGTQTARSLIYSARWFEAFLLFFIIVLIYNMVKFKSYKKAKWSTFVFHASFLIIGIGAALTRYVGFEGIMHIREGSTSSSMVSDVKIFQIDATRGEEKAHFESPRFFSSMTSNSLSESLAIGDKEVKVELLEYLPAVEKQIVPDEKNGKMILSLKVSGGVQGRDIQLSKGEHYDAGSFVVTFGDTHQHNDGKAYFNIRQAGDKLEVDTSFDIKTLSMLTQKEQNLTKGVNLFERKKLYQFNNNGMVVLREVYEKASKKFVNSSLKTVGGKPEMTRFSVSVGDKSQEVTLLSFSGNEGEVETLTFDDIEVKLSLGAKVINLPFAIKLNDFQLERYPGSNSPSSYASEVVLLDKEQGINMPFRIYMNHVLDHRNYRFFQSSYDRDEQGTILSVNHDPGTLVTYIGYLMMIIGMFWNLFAKGSRFQKLLARSKKLQSASLTILVSLILFGATTPIQASEPKLDEVNQKILESYDADVVEQFSRLIIQDRQGRMKPIDTLAHEIVAKLSGKTSLYGIDASAIFLGMTTNPMFFQDLEMIKISHTKVAQDIGLDKDAKYAKFSDFFDEKNGYKLQKQLEVSARKKPFDKNQYDTQLIKIDERLSVAYMVYMGTLLQIYPIPKDANNRWVNPQEAIKTFPEKLSTMIRQMTGHLFNGVEHGVKDGNWTDANQALDIMTMYQKKFGSEVMLSETHLDMELKYNSLGLLSKIVPIYLVVGILLLILSFINVLKPSFSLKWVMKITLGVTLFGFILHLAGMGMRWYIAGHAPWSNAYESIVFISASTIVAGLFFARKSPFTLGATAFLAGVTLAVAHMSFVNPEITNLVPVLKSYWLMIHVALMISGDGFLGLGSMLSLLVLILFIIRKGGHENIDRAIKELSSIAEMSLIVGIFLFTIGNFLGGVWANESWGRYWGWDSKETWSAVSILIYATVIHLRFIPKYNNLFIFNVASMWAYSTVIMTYFGVNYYLSGLHSYAAGEPIPIPMWVYYGTASLFALTLLAYRNRNMK
jgi:cytochrome c-type biogenesis protein CcsB